MTETQYDGEVEFEGVVFRHYTNDTFQGWQHVDAAGRSWEVYRFIQEEALAGDPRWKASVFLNDSHMALNTADINRAGLVTRKGPLYSTDSTQSRPLLEAMAALVVKGEWPEEIDVPGGEPRNPTGGPCYMEIDDIPRCGEEPREPAVREEFTVVGFYDADRESYSTDPFVEHVTCGGGEYVGVEGAIRAVAEQKVPLGTITVVAVFEGHLTDVSAALGWRRVTEIVDGVAEALEVNG